MKDRLNFAKSASQVCCHRTRSVEFIPRLYSISYRFSRHNFTWFTFYLIYGWQGQLPVQFNIKPNKEVAINGGGGIGGDQNGMDEDETEDNVDDDDVGKDNGRMIIEVNCESDWFWATCE